MAQLSVAEIRARFLDGSEAVSPRLLGQLKRDPRQGVRKLYESLRRKAERQRQERLRLDAMLNFERLLWKSGVEHVAGVDEAGMGPLAGPVVAAAVVFAPGSELEGVDDSKRVEPERRQELAQRIRAVARGVALGVVEVEEIDRVNIYQAGLLAMRRAVEALPTPPQHVLVDARTIPGLPMPQNTFQKGDGIDFTIAAASIVAKVHRDALMEALDARHPGYGFARHKGYGTAAHQAAIRRLGPSPVHRMSFPFLRELRGKWSPRFYELKRSLDGARSRDALASFEADFEAGREALRDEEQRKLRTLLSRRWRTL